MKKSIYFAFSMGIGDWGLGIGDWGLGPIPNPQSPNPQSPIPKSPFNPYQNKFKEYNNIIYKIKLLFALN